MPFTSLRNGFYVTTAVFLLRRALATGVLAAPEDGPFSWTAHADLAETTAIVLTEGGFEGRTPAFTGPEALGMADLAEIGTELSACGSGRTRRRARGAMRARSPGGEPAGGEGGART
ncbi:hypothetical protein ACMHYB_48520 [Sorangium sp. So ce1128]